MSILLQDQENFLSKYKDKPVELLTQIFEEEAAIPFEIVTNNIKCFTNILTFDYVHEINTLKYFSPKLEIIEANSSGKMSRLGEKFIHRFDNRIESIETDAISNYSKTPTLFTSYDSYIQKHGKLFMRKYYATKSFSPDQKIVLDKFLTFNPDVYKKSNERTKHVVYSIIPYQIYDGDILSYSLIKLDNGNYKIKVKLDPLYANDYYAFEIIHRGALFDYPKFISTEFELTLNNRFKLIEAKTFDKFIAKSGIITANLTVESIHHFYQSNNSIFNINDKNTKIVIPNNIKKDFSLFNFLKVK